jgi:hypothetical protein
MSLPTTLARFADEGGRLRTWPSRKQGLARREALEWIARHFEAGRVYSEKEVNAVIDGLHSFQDIAYLRRELVDRGHLVRDPYGREYQLAG